MYYSEPEINMISNRTEPKDILELISKCELHLSWVLNHHLVNWINSKAKISLIYNFLMVFSQLADYEESIKIFIQSDSDKTSQLGNSKASNSDHSQGLGLNNSGNASVGFKNRLSIRFNNLKQKLNSENLDILIQNMCPGVFGSVGASHASGFESFFGGSVFLFLQLSKPIYNLDERKIEEYKQNFKGMNLY